jgi:hypothetical protein
VSALLPNSDLHSGRQKDQLRVKEILFFSWFENLRTAKLRGIGEKEKKEFEPGVKEKKS